MSVLSPDEILALLQSPEPQTTTQPRPFVHDPRNNMPRNKHVQWVETKHVCTHADRCGSAAYLKIDGNPRCQSHALKDLINILNEVENA